MASDIDESDLAELGKAVQNADVHPADTQDHAAVRLQLAALCIRTLCHGAIQGRFVVGQFCHAF